MPENIGCIFGDDIILDAKAKKLYVTLGQFSIIRLERDAQLLMPVYDICMPAKDCSCSGGGGDRTEDPCDMFERFAFPVDEFFPPARENGDADGCSCGCKCTKQDECCRENKPRFR